MRQAYTDDQLVEFRKIAAATPISSVDHITGKTDVDITWLKMYYPGATSAVTITSGHFQGVQWIPDIATATMTVGVAFIEISSSFGIDPQDYQIRVDDKDTLKADVSALALDSTVSKEATVALEATLTAMKGATFATGTDSLEAIRNRGDAAWVTGGGATVEEIDTELTTNHGSGSWQSVAGSVGVGPVTVNIVDQFAAAVIGANVVITDTVGSGDYSGGGTTDGNGDVIIDALATGDYTIVATATGYEIPDTALTVTSVAQDVDIVAEKRVINAPSDPTLGTLFGDTVKITGTAAVGVEVIAKKTSADVVYVDGNAVTKYERTTTTDANGQFTIDLLKDVELTIKIDQLDYEEDITLTADTTNLEDAT